MFRRTLAMPFDFIAVENPRQYPAVHRMIGRGPDDRVDLWHFGDPESKATYFWLKNLPPLMATIESDFVPGTIWKAKGKGAARQKERSRTRPGIAQAMAEQWGAYVQGR